MAILWVSGGIAVFLGWFFKPMRWFIPLGVCLAYLAVDLYGGDIKHADGFLLKYLLSSQSAIMWQCAFVFFALFAYIVGAIAAVRKNVPSNTLLGMGTVFAWVSAVAGFVGLLVRWHESYLLRPDAGHIPVFQPLRSIHLVLGHYGAECTSITKAVLPYKNWAASSSALWRLWSDLSCGTAFHARRMPFSR